MSARSIEERLKRVEDELAIQRILFDYSAFLDEGDYESYLGLFAEDAEWSNFDDTRRAGEQKVEYRVSNDTLERIAYPMLDGADALPPAALLTNVRQVALRYRLDGAWSDRWQGTPRAPLPQALELRLTRSDGTEFRQLFLVGTGYRPTVKAPNAT